MTRAWRAIGALAALAGGTLLAGSAAAVTAADKCEAAKNLIAGKYGFCRQNAEAKAIKRGEQPDYTKCDAKFADKWSKAEAAGSCPTTVDQATQKARLTTNANRTACQLSGPRFNDNADGTITDRQTCLMWEKKIKLYAGADYVNLQAADNTYPWAGYCSVNTGKACQPTAAASAACTAGAGNPTYCAECTGGDGACTVSYGGGDTVWAWLVALNTASFATHGDWRVPTRDELQSIIDYADGTAPVVDVAFQGAMCGGSCGFLGQPDCSCTYPGNYFTASAYAPNSAYGWGVDFTSGLFSQLYTNIYYYPYYLRAVRSVR